MTTADELDPDAPTAVVRRTEVLDGAARDADDQLVREEPLELRIGGVPIAVVMRTPGHDEELAAGFLVTERIVAEPAQVASIRHCSNVDAPEAENNVILVVLQPDVHVDLARLRRNLYTSSSCGLCGKTSIENAMQTAPPIDDGVQVSADVLYTLPERLRSAQTVFSATGGLHAAGLFDPGGEPLVVREDVGRHNAVDKVVGWALRRGHWPLSGLVLAVSGRISFEITQKALAARIPIVSAVSAPSSLAVQLAEEAAMTVVAFVRGRRLCVYAGGHRVV